MRAGFKPTSLIEYKRFRIIHHRPTRSGEQTILEAGCAANTIQRASRAFEIIGLPHSILPCNTSLLERDGKGFACKAPRCDLIFQMQEIGFDLNERVGYVFPESGYRLFAIPKGLRRTILKAIRFAVFESNESVGQHREADVLRRDDSTWVGDGQKCGSGRQGHRNPLKVCSG